ncbi:Uncharacterised protein [Serratia quinivorans]|uniref:hypothetical protein n=1 Tax=Serratia quinivorans TaxID=137545 RepID=UPI0021788C3E|nr:hypothetical protein [Serratia quinivorans]CAI1769926.1 Uncharacterised protein [Serratia quinivorans]
MIKSSMAAMPIAASAAAPTNSQLTASPPQVYQPPRINLGNLDTLHKVLDRELVKIGRAQSYLLSLYQQLQESQQQNTELKAQVTQMNLRITALERSRPIWGSTENNQE